MKEWEGLAETALKLERTLSKSLQYMSNLADVGCRRQMVARWCMPAHSHRRQQARANRLWQNTLNKTSSKHWGGMPWPYLAWEKLLLLSFLLDHCECLILWVEDCSHPLNPRLWHGVRPEEATPSYLIQHRRDRQGAGRPSNVCYWVT